MGVEMTATSRMRYHTLEHQPAPCNLKWGISEIKKYIKKWKAEQQFRTTEGKSMEAGPSCTLIKLKRPANGQPKLNSQSETDSITKARRTGYV